MLQGGHRLGGYQIVELVGRGGMGEVYRAKQLSMDREVALKVLSPRLAKLDPSFAERFVAEARAAGRLNHPNIVAVHDVSTAPAPEGCHGVATGETINFFSMEFVEGETVRDVIERQGAIDAETVARVMTGMAEALAFAESHRIIHRDIKPDNIILPVNGGSKLADLGLALQIDEAQAVTGKDEDGTSKVMGTPLYMAPEQAQAKPVDFRADQYALGATLFHMLVGRPPYSGEDARTIMRAHCFSPVPDPMEANPQVSPPWRDLCMRLMAKAPEERFASSSDLRGAVKTAVRWRPPHAPRARTQRQGGPWLAVAAVVAVAGGAWVAFSAMGRSGTPEPTRPPPTGPTPATPSSSRLGPVSDPAAGAEHARSELARLPDDPELALRVVDRLLNDPGIGSARPEVEKRRELIVAAIEERHRIPLNAALARAERSLEVNRLGEVRSTLDQLPDEEWLRQRRDLLRSRLHTAETAAETRLTAAIANANTPADCGRVRDDIEGAGLPDPSRSTLQAKLAERLAAIKAAQELQSSQAAAASARWSKLAERLEPQRGVQGASSFKDLCSSAVADFAGDEQTLVRALGGVPELAQKAETALKNYVAQTKPKADCRFGPWAGQAQILGLDSKEIRYLVPEKPEARADRATAVMPWRQLLDESAISKTDPRSAAAFLWYWRVAGTSGALQRIADDPLAKAIATYDRLSRPIDLAGEVVRRDPGVAVAYAFAETRAKELLADWSGAEIGPAGLHWSTDQRMNGSNDADLPTLRWKAQLRPPLTLEAQVMCDPGTYTLMLGVSAGGTTIRAALLTQSGRAVTVMTDPDNGRFSVTTPILDISPGDSKEVRASKLAAAIPFDPTKPCRVRIEIDAKGTVALWLDDKPMQSRRPTVLPVGPISVVLQANQPSKATERAGGSIPSLVITGTP